MDDEATRRRCSLYSKNVYAALSVGPGLAPVIVVVAAAVPAQVTKQEGDLIIIRISLHDWPNLINFVLAMGIKFALKSSLIDFQLHLCFRDMYSIAGKFLTVQMVEVARGVAEVVGVVRACAQHEVNYSAKRGITAVTNEYG